MGADRGLLVRVDGPAEPLAVAKILKGVVAAEPPSLPSSASGRSTTIATRRREAALLDGVEKVLTAENAV